MTIPRHRSSSTTAPDKLAQRMMQQAHLRDGLPEILTGVILLLAAAQSYTMAALSHGGPLALKRSLLLAWAFLVIAMTISVCSIPGAPGTGWLLRWLRRRYLTSKSGYVKLKSRWSKRSLALMIGAGLLTAAALLVARRAVTPLLLDRGMFIAIGVLVGGAEAFVGRSPRFVVMGALTVGCGFLLAFCPRPVELRFAVLYAFTGAGALVCGAIALTRFMHTSADGE